MASRNEVLISLRENVRSLGLGSKVEEDVIGIVERTDHIVRNDMRQFNKILEAATGR